MNTPLFKASNLPHPAQRLSALIRSKKTRRAWLIAPAAVAALFALAGCGPHVNKIGDLNDDPGKYMHQDVTVEGEVTRVYELPLGIANLAAYRINDGSGQIWVVTHNGAPNRGDHLGLRGELEPIADMGMGGGSVVSNLFGNVIEEHNRKFAN